MKGYPVKPISAFFTVTSSKRVHKADWRKSGVPFYRAREIVTLAKEGKVDNELFISENLFQEFSNKHGIPQPDDLMVSAVGTIGECYIVKDSDRFYFKDASVIWFKKNKEIESRYVEYAMKSDFVRDQIMNNSMGATVRTYTISRAKKTKIPIPPLPEQKRIVAILDMAFEAINRARTNIEKNIQNAEELFQSKLNEIFEQRGEGWEEKPLSELTYVKSGGTPRRSTKDYWEDGSIPWYSSGELNELYTNDPKDLITEKGLKESNAKLFPKGSLLIGMYDTAALKLSILDRDGTFNQAISGAKPNKGLNLQFVMHAINSIKPELMRQRRGIRQKNLNLTKIKAIPIPFPKIEIQDEVVTQLGELKDYSNNLIDNYRWKLKELEELKKSFLQKAFSGELTQKKTVAA